MVSIVRIATHDIRYPLGPGEGADALHTNPVYAYAVTLLHTDSALAGTGIALTLGDGNDLVCSAIAAIAESLIGQEIEALMESFGSVLKRMANHPRYRWLGPHKGVIHLALASIVNACFDLWAKARGVPLWRLLLDLSPEQIVHLLDLSYLEDVLTEEDALQILEANRDGRAEREQLIRGGYPGYDTSVGWIHYTDDQVRENLKRTMSDGFSAIKLKIGTDISSDVRRAHLVRNVVGDSTHIMLDCNQAWSLPEAITGCRALASMSPYWIEEPTHPDDVCAHKTLVDAVTPLKVALGEHVPNRVVFKNYFQEGAIGFCQVDCTRVAGVSEFIAVSLLARKFGVPVVPHVGDMGQIHQHLVRFNCIALGHDPIFLEHIPHLHDHFTHPARIENGVYQIPTEPGNSSDLR